MSNSILYKRFMRIICLCLSAMLLCSTALAENEQPRDQPVLLSALPTPTPEPTPGPTETQLAEVTPEVPPVTEAPPSQSATPGETEPTGTAPVEGTPAPTPSLEPTATPTLTPAPTPISTPARDESQCDHVTELCSRAPKCALQDCAHIGLNGNNDIVALCPLGKWLLAAANQQRDEALDQGISLMSASAPTAYALKSGNNIIYRSGTYLITNAAGAANPSLYVGKGLVVSLSLQNVSMTSLYLQDNVIATLGFTGQNTISTIAAPNAALTIDGSGSLTVNNNFNAPKPTLRGGSISLPASVETSNGRAMYLFNAPNANNAKVDGEAFCSFKPQESTGNVYLWLPKLHSPLTYSMTVDGSTLNVSSLPQAPGDQIDYDLSSSSSFIPAQGKAYRIISSGTPNSQTLVINQNDVSLSLSGVNGKDSLTVQAQADTTLFLTNENSLSALAGSSQVVLSGSGTLSIGELTATNLQAVGTMTISCDSAAPVLSAAWQQVPVAGNLSLSTVAKYNKGKIALLFSAQAPTIAYLRLPSPAPGTHYTATLKNNTLLVETAAGAPSPLTLGDDELTVDSGNFELVCKDGTAQIVRIAAGANVSLALRNVHTTGGLIIGEGARVTLALNGSNSFGIVELGGSVLLEINATGALLAKGLTNTSNNNKVTVLGTTNASFAALSELPASKLKRTEIIVTDNNNAALANREIALKLGAEAPFTTTTDARGRVTLWRSKKLSKIDVVVLSDANTYASLLNDGTSVAPGALPVITDIKLSKGVIKFTAKDANSLGIQYMIGKDKTVRDGFHKEAKQVMMLNGECNIPGLKDGDVVTFRAFAAVEGGMTLTAATSDGFGFSDQQTYTAKDVRKGLAIKPQSKTYDEKAFAFASGILPSDVNLVYYKGGTKLDNPPKAVGDYIAKITIPAGNSSYLPGVYDVKVSILRILVKIYPEQMKKIQGNPDPEFIYTYDHEAMLGEDVVTGRLTRNPGESYGNYSYRADKLSAPDYYELFVDDNTYSFFVDWGPHHYLPYDPFKKIDPVYDTLLFSNGEQLEVQIRANEILKVNSTYYGKPVSDLEDGKVRPVTPTIRLRGGVDEALLILTAEPELNEDGGYATDADGNRVLRGRKLTLNYFMLNGFKQKKINYLAFSLGGTSVFLPLDELREGEALAKLMEKNGVTRNGTSFSIVLEPILPGSVLAENEVSATNAAAMKEQLMRVSIMLKNGDKEFDILPALSDIKLFFDASGLLPTPEELTKPSDVSESVNGKEQTQTMQELAAVSGSKGETETTPELLEIALALLQKEIQRRGSTLVHYTDTETKLDAVAVVPYTSSEAQTEMFTAMLRTKPYLTTRLTQSGLYGLRAEIQQ